jgi:O-antigen ligase
MLKECLRLYNNTDALFVALVLNINVLRVFLGITDTNYVLYMVYVLALFFIAKNNQSKIKFLLAHNKGIKLCLLFVFYIIFFSAVSILWTSYDNIIIFLKFCVTLVLAVSCISLSFDKIKKIKYYFLVINILYSIQCITTPSRIDSLLGDEMNYLNATLTLGFSLGIALVGLFEALFNNRLSLLIGWLLLAALFFISLLGFVARGVLLFPPIIAIAMIPLMGRGHRGKMLIVLGVAAMVILSSVHYYMNLASDYGASRMLSLFENPEEQDRIELWQQCTTIMIEKCWFVFGGGLCVFSSAIYYPHNIFLQILGEFGVFPFIVFLYMLIVLFKHLYMLIKIDKYKEKGTVFFLAVGILYYILTFSKSFSLYDALPLFIMMALMHSYYIDIYYIKKII